MVQKLLRAEFDMPLALGVGVAVLAACSNLASEQQRPWLWWLGYLGLTVGFLAKGVPALILPKTGMLSATERCLGALLRVRVKLRALDERSTKPLRCSARI